VTRAQLEHIIRAACAVADDKEVIVIGSQAILGQFPLAPAALVQSLEADVYPKNHPERAELIDGALGELSMFHETFGYYADGVGEKTATLPRDWSARLVPICNANTLGGTGWCLEIHDLLVSKYVAGRDKDLRFAAVAAQHHLVDRSTLLDRLATTPLESSQLNRVHAFIERDFAFAARE
jgi:hypothetical protein